MSEWFVREDDVEIGPLTGKEILDLIRAGSVVYETLVRKNDSAWFEAGAVGGLFEAASEATTDYYCPECNSQVEKPPVVCPYCEIHLAYAISKRVEHHIPGFTPKPKPKRSASMDRWLQRMQSPPNE